MLALWLALAFLTALVFASEYRLHKANKIILSLRVQVNQQIADYEATIHALKLKVLAFGGKTARKTRRGN